MFTVNNVTNDNISLMLQALTIDSNSRIRVKGLTIQNSQQMHFVISHSDSVQVSNILISAPGDSPNTDGIHISASTDITLLNCKIGTGFFVLLKLFYFDTMLLLLSFPDTFKKYEMVELELVHFVLFLVDNRLLIFGIFAYYKAPLFFLGFLG